MLDVAQTQQAQRTDTSLCVQIDVSILWAYWVGDDPSIGPLIPQPPLIASWRHAYDCSCALMSAHGSMEPSSLVPIGP